MYGKKIIAFRATHNLSLKELESLLDNTISDITINAYENSMYEPPKHFKVKFDRIVEEYGIDYEKLKLKKYKKRGYKRTVKPKESLPEVATTELLERPASAHYHIGKIDVWQFAEENYTTEQVTAFHGINAIKYITRFGKKEGYNKTDLEKAIACIREMIRLHSKEETA